MKITTNSVEIRTAGPAPLWNKYEGQYQPQPAFFRLDTRDGHFSAEINYELGGWPERIYFGHDPIWRVDAQISRNAILERLGDKSILAMLKKYMEASGSKDYETMERLHTDIGNCLEASAVELTYVWDACEFFLSHQSENSILDEIGILEEDDAHGEISEWVCSEVENASFDGNHIERAEDLIVRLVEAWEDRNVRA